MIRVAALLACLACLALAACGPSYLDNPNLTPGDVCRSEGNVMRGATCVPGPGEFGARRRASNDAGADASP